MRYIERVRISGFKSIREIAYKGRHETQTTGLPLGDLSVLIGANGTGKSNFLSFFNLVRTIVEDDPAKLESDKHADRVNRLHGYITTSGGAHHFLYFGIKATQEITADIWLLEDQNQPVTPVLSYAFTLAPTNDGFFVFSKEACRYDSPNPRGLGDQPQGAANITVGGAGAEALFTKAVASDQVRAHFEAMAPIRVYHFPDAGATSPARRVSDVDDNRYLRPEGDNIAALLYLLKRKHPSSYREIANVVRLVFPFFEDFQLAPLALNENKIKLEWKESGEDAYRDASYLSDGTLRFICLATLLLQPKPPGLILIDEPELGLHPYAIGVLADLLKAASNKSQLIVSTQSVTVVNQVGPEDIIVVERQKEPESYRYETVFKRLEKADLEQWLEDYGMGDLWEKNLIGGRP